MPLYTLEILNLAASTATLEPVLDSQVAAERRSPTCGSRVRVGVTVDSDGAVESLGVDVNACALGQASAALMAAHAKGLNSVELAQARDLLRTYLKGQAPRPGDWPGLEIFAPARERPGRHASIMLAFEAVAEATELAGT